MKIQFGLNNEIVAIDDTDGVTDPSKEQKYTDSEKRAAAANVSPADAKLSPQQVQLDKQVKHVEYLETKANAIHGYDEAGQPRFVESESERARLLKIAGMERENLALSAQLAELSLGEDALDRHNEQLSLQQQMAEHAALEERARAIARENQAQELAKLFAPKASKGGGLKIR
jgi:hypothetical protein